MATPDETAAAVTAATATAILAWEANPADAMAPASVAAKLVVVAAPAAAAAEVAAIGTRYNSFENCNCDFE